MRIVSRLQISQNPPYQQHRSYGLPPMIITKKFNMLAISTSILLFVFSNYANAETTETIEYKNYTISPRLPHEIKYELMRHTPIRERGGSFNGHTDWYVDWHYRARQGANTCHINNIRTNAHVVHTLPVLSPYVTDEQTIAVFNKFNTALTLHEHNHGKHGISAAREIDNALHNLQMQRNCRYASRMIDEIGNTIIKKYVYADSEYDRNTQNGLSEGAVIY